MSRLVPLDNEAVQALAAQRGAQEAWAANMLHLSTRVTAETLDELARLGPEGAALVQQFVDATPAELARLEPEFLAGTAAATAAVRGELEAAAPLLREVAATLGQGVADGMAAELNAGTTTVARIMHDYQRAIANGVNPILLAMGRQGVQIAGITGPGGFVESSGGVVDYYANGAVQGRESHVAQIAPAGAWRVWAEPETGGEAYLPLLVHRSPRRPAEKVAPGLFVVDVAPSGAEDSAPGVVAGVEVEAPVGVLVAA